MNANGQQLYGLSRLLTTVRMGFHREVLTLSLQKKLAMNFALNKSKLTKHNGKIYTNTFTPFYPSLAYDRFLKGVLSVAEGKPVPLVVNFAITSRCPCNCWHCSFSDRNKKDGMTLKELKGAIQSVLELGTSVIGITGGEPLLRKDLEQIIESIGERAMPIFFTTGTNLTASRVKSLKNAGLVIPVVSLDHYDEKIHDKGRNKKGAYRSALKAIEMFQAEGFYVGVSFVPTKKLLSSPEEAFKVIEFFKDLGINDMRLTSPILSGELTCRPEEKLSPEQIQTIFKIQEMCVKKRGYPGVFAYDYFESKMVYGCGAGYNYMFIDSMGNLSPCDFTMISLGNIKKTPLKQVWKKTSQRFCSPGCDCYANVISNSVSKMKSKTWPLNEKNSQKILDKHPSFNSDELPEFYRRMGLGKIKNKKK